MFSALLALAVAACATSNSIEPSLAPRAAEAIDPRLPIASEPVLGPVDPALGARLEQLAAGGREGGRTFDAAVGQAEALAGAAGPRESESWIVAQQALSGLESARARTTAALSDVDAIAAGRIQSGAGLTPSDLAAVEAVSNELRTLADRQSSIIDRIGTRLGR